jgi:arabinogalactan endo-1,4-beta-galactosidase
MNRIVTLFFASALFSIAYSQNENFIRGVDLSFTPQIEDLGGQFKVNGVSKDVLDIFKENGANYVRLRLWHTPQDGYCGLQKTLAFAKRIKEKGLKFLLDIHYSDSWADPSKQTKPAAWTNLPYPVLKDSVYNYTKNVITLLKNQNTLPDMVQIGNEIIQGMLWQDGKVNGSNGWVALGELLKKGIQGTKDAANGTPIKIMLHINNGWDNAASIWWFGNIIAQNVEFDVIGLSFYPWGNDVRVTLNALENNVNDLANKYGKEINIVETAYPWTLEWKDNVNNIYGSSSQLLIGYPATVHGQYDFVKSIVTIVTNIPNTKGNGFFYWAPDWISTNNFSSSWENMTFFDFDGEMLNSITALNFGNPTNVSNIKLTDSFQLNQNYPNPFNPSTTIQYTIPEASKVSVIIYDIMGQEISKLVDGFKNAGNYSVTWTANNIPSGIYFCRMITQKYMETKKIVFMK